MFKNINKRDIGFTFAIISAILWGISGNLAEYIFKNSNIDGLELAALRMFLAGIILLVYVNAKNGTKELRSFLKDKIARKDLIIYTIFGIIFVQMPYFKAIDYSTAPFATLVQFAAPIFIIFYIAYVDRKKPSRIEITSTVLAVIGIFYILTNGNIKTLSVSPLAIFWGFISALGFAFYLLYIKRLFKWSTSLVTGAGMTIGGIILLFVVKDLSFLNEFYNPKIILIFSFNVILGTVIPFVLFLESTRYISPKETSLLSSFEPLTTLIVSKFIMNANISIIQVIGAFFIITAVSLLSFNKKNKIKGVEMYEI